MFWFTRDGLVSAVGSVMKAAARCPDVIPAQPWRVWMFVFPAGAAADASRLPFHVSGCELNPEIWEEVPPNVAPASAAKEHPTPFLRVKISLFSYANKFLFRVGVAEGGAAPKMWAGIRVGLLRNETRLEGSLFWPNESVFF